MWSAYPIQEDIASAFVSHLYVNKRAIDFVLQELGRDASNVNG